MPFNFPFTNTRRRPITQPRDRVTMHAFGIDGERANGFDLVNWNSFPSVGGYRPASSVQVGHLDVINRELNIKYLHLTWSNVLLEIADYGTPKGAQFPQNPYANFLNKRPFDPDTSPIFVSASDYREASSFFTQMSWDWTDAPHFPVVLGMGKQKISVETGLTKLSSKGIKSKNINAVFAPEERVPDARKIWGGDRIAVESWPKGMVELADRVAAEAVI